MTTVNDNSSNIVSTMLCSCCQLLSYMHDMMLCHAVTYHNTRMQDNNCSPSMCCSVNCPFRRRREANRDAPTECTASACSSSTAKWQLHAQSQQQQQSQPPNCRTNGAVDTNKQTMFRTVKHRRVLQKCHKNQQPRVTTGVAVHPNSMWAHLVQLTQPTCDPPWLQPTAC